MLQENKGGRFTYGEGKAGRFTYVQRFERIIVAKNTGFWDPVDGFAIQLIIIVALAKLGTLESLIQAKRDRRLLASRTPYMNTSAGPGKAHRTMRVHIVDVIERKEGGCTMIVHAPVESEKMVAQIWHSLLPGDYQGAIRVGRVWHLYYGKDPRYTPDSWIEVVLPENVPEA